MKTVRIMNQIRTPKHILLASLFLLFLSNPLFATENAEKENDCSAVELAEINADASNFFESELMVEERMTLPFESKLFESELMVEEWMTLPFESKFKEPELMLEDWMTSTF